MIIIFVLRFCVFLFYFIRAHCSCSSSFCVCVRRLLFPLVSSRSFRCIVSFEGLMKFGMRHIIYHSSFAAIRRFWFFSFAFFFCVFHLLCASLFIQLMPNARANGLPFQWCSLCAEFHRTTRSIHHSVCMHNTMALEIKLWMAILVLPCTPKLLS